MKRNHRVEKTIKKNQAILFHLSSYRNSRSKEKVSETQKALIFFTLHNLYNYKMLQKGNDILNSRVFVLNS